MLSALCACEISSCIEAKEQTVVEDVGHDPIPDGVVRRVDRKFSRCGGNVIRSAQDEK